MAIDAGKVVALLELDTSAFSGGLNTARGMLKTFGDESATATDKLRAVEKAAGSFGATMSAAVTPPLVAAGAAAVKTFSSFDDAMRQVRATMNATDEETVALTESAKRMGAETRYSAGEAANALNYLALAGYDANQSIAALPTVLNLAQAGSLDLAYASDLVTDSMSALELGMDQLTGFTDQLAVTSQKSNTSISQLGQAILTVGGTAKALRGGTVELNAELGILADSGIKGAEGGTHLRNAILALQNPTEAGAKALKKYTNGVYDAEGRMRSLDAIFGELARSMDAMNDAQKATVLNDIFNKTDLAAAQALIAGAGERFQELTGYIADCDGAAQKMAETMEGGIGGAFRSLTSATEGLAIEFGENLAPFVQTATERVTDLTRGFTNLSESQQNTILTVGGLVAAGGPALLMISKIAGAIASINPVVAGVTVGLAALAAAIHFIRDEADWTGRMDRKLNIGISDVELEQYRLPDEVEDLGTMKAAFRLEIENKGKSAYEQIKAIMNDGVPESEEDYAKMADGVNAVIDASMKAIEDNYNQRAANIQALFDSGVLNEAEYEQQMADLKAKTEEQETALTASAANVTDYIKDLIAANAPMTEKQLEYLQQLIDKLVEASVAAGEATDAVLTGYKMAYERVKSGQGQEGDIEQAAAYIEHEYDEKREAINAAGEAKQAESGKKLEGVQEGTDEYEAVLAESAAAAQKTQEQLAGAYAEKNADYAEMLAAAFQKIGMDPAWLDSLRVPGDAELLSPWQALSRLFNGDQNRDLEQRMSGKDLTEVRDIVGYWAANGNGEPIDLSTSAGVLEAASVIMGYKRPDETGRRVGDSAEDTADAIRRRPKKGIRPTKSPGEETEAAPDYFDLEEIRRQGLAEIDEIFDNAIEKLSGGESLTQDEFNQLALGMPSGTGAGRVGGSSEDAVDWVLPAKRGFDELIKSAAEAQTTMEELYGSAEAAEEAAGEAAEGAQTALDDLTRPLTDEEKANFPTAQMSGLISEAAEETEAATEGAQTSLDNLLADAEQVFADLPGVPGGMTGPAWNGGYVYGASMGDGFSAGFAEHAVIPGIATNGTLSGSAGVEQTGGNGASGTGSGKGGNTFNITFKDTIMRAEEDIRATARKLGSYINAVNFGQ